MRALHRTLPLAVAALLAVESGRSRAPPARRSAAIDVRAQLPEPARKAWDAAKQLAGASDYSGALVEFQRAYELSHNPRVLFNVGVTEKLLTHYARAVDAWEKELSEGAGKLTPCRAAGAEERDRDRAAVRHDDRRDRERGGRDALDRRLPGRQDALRRAGANRRRQARAQAGQGRVRRRGAAGRRRGRRQDAGRFHARAAEQDGARLGRPWAARRAPRCSSTGETWARRLSRES